MPEMVIKRPFVQSQILVISLYVLFVSKCEAADYLLTLLNLAIISDKVKLRDHPFRTYKIWRGGIKLKINVTVKLTVRKIYRFYLTVYRS